VTELRGCVDPLELDLLGGAAGSVDEHGLAESDNALLDTRDGTLEHNEVVVDLSVADEATHGGDGLLGDIEMVEALPASSPRPIR